MDSDRRGFLASLAALAIPATWLRSPRPEITPEEVTALIAEDFLEECSRRFSTTEEFIGAVQINMRLKEARGE